MKESGENKKERVLLEEGKMSESEITKARFKYFFTLVGILLVLVFISIFLLLIMDKDLPPSNDKQKQSKNLNNWEDSQKKAKEYVSKLNLKEKISLLYGTENMRFLNPKKRTHQN